LPKQPLHQHLKKLLHQPQKVLKLKRSIHHSFIENASAHSVGIFISTKSKMDKKDSYKVGYILKPHGLKGAVTVSIDPDTPNDFQTLNIIFIQQDDNLVPYVVESISVKGDKAFVKFEDVETPEAAAEISKKSMFLPKTARPKSGRGEFYDDEILNFTVSDENHGELGKIEEVMTVGPNKMLVVMFEGREVLIPVNGPFITGINKTKKKVAVTLPDGFLDI
jgi:16S rRNA processing protein RimM